VQQLDQLSEKLEDAQEKLLKGKMLSAESFEEWRTHPVTQLLMLELKQQQLAALSSTIPMPSNFIGKDLLVGKIEAIEEVLDWNPREEAELEDEA